MNRLTSKTALVTGGASGIGAATAQAIAAEGGRVVIADVSDEKGRALAKELGEHAAYTHLDVTDEASWQQAVQFAEETFGGLNVLVNSAGILTRGRLGEQARETWERTLAVNLTGPFLGITASVEVLKRNKPASIVNVSSYAGLRGVSPQHAYTASKFGLRGLTKSAALELADAGVRINSVHPGSVRTPMIAADLEAYAEFLEGATSTLVRPGEPGEIAALIVFLASDESSFSTGAEFIADGGLSAGMAIG